MSVFSLLCSTCHARLVVKSDRALGQIHPCPKCGGMVLIERSVIEGDVDSDDSERISKSSSQRRRTNHRSGSRGSAPCIAEAALLANTFEQVDLLLAGEHQSALIDGQFGAPVHDGRMGEGPPGTSRSHERLRGIRRTTWIIGLAALSGILVGFALIHLLIPRSIRHAARVDSTAPTPAPVATISPVDPPPVQTPPPVQESPQDDRTSAGLTGIQQEQVLKPIVPEPPAEQSNIVPQSALPDTPVDVTAPAIADVPEANEHSTAIRIDSSLFDDGPNDAPIQVKVAGGATTHDARQRIGQAIASLQVPQIQLGAFLRLMERVADVPVSVEHEAFAMARIDSVQPMSIDVREHTVGETLAKGLRPLNLGYRLTDSHVIVEHRATLENRPASLRLEVDDLLDRYATVSAIATLIEESGVVGVDPVASSSQLHLESAAIVVQAAPPAQFRVLRFLEQLRLANRLPTRTVYGSGIQAAGTHRDRGRELLAQAIVRQWSHRATLSQIAEVLHDQTKAHFLIDWPALEQADIHYQTQIEIAGQPGSLQELLRAFQQVGIWYHVVDDHTIELTSREGEWSSGVIAFYPLREWIEVTGNRPEELVSSIQAAFAESLARDGLEWSAMEPRFVHDPGSNQLVVRLPPSMLVRFERGWERLRRAGNVAKSTFRNVHSRS